MAKQALARSTPSGRFRPLGVLLSFFVALVVADPGLAAAPGAELPAPAKSGLLLYGELRVLPAVLELDEGIRVRFAESVLEAQLFSEYLDLSWATEPRYQDHARAFLRDKYGARPLDAVIALGIAEQDLERIFDTIARSLVESHGGRLVAENNKQGGATFTFTVPYTGPGAA